MPTLTTMKSSDVAAAMSIGPAVLTGSVYTASCCSTKSLPSGMTKRSMVVSLGPPPPARTARVAQGQGKVRGVTP